MTEQDFINSEWIHADDSSGPSFSRWGKDCIYFIHQGSKGISAKRILSTGANDRIGLCGSINLAKQACWEKENG